MSWTAVLLAIPVVFVILVVYAKARAGRSQLSEDELRSARVLMDLSPDDPDVVWQELGSLTTCRALDLKFDHDDDPQAEATLLAPGAVPRPGSLISNVVEVRLGAEFETHHVHTAGYAFRVCLRGTGGVVDKITRIKMMVDGHGRPYGARMENDDGEADQAAVGDWIEIKRAEILEIPRRR